MYSLSNVLRLTIIMGLHIKAFTHFEYSRGLSNDFTYYIQHFIIYFPLGIFRSFCFWLQRYYNIQSTIHLGEGKSMTCMLCIQARDMYIRFLHAYQFDSAYRYSIRLLTYLINLKKTYLIKFSNVFFGKKKQLTELYNSTHL